MKSSGSYPSQVQVLHCPQFFKN